jgi:hypothetical protein
MAQQGLEGSEKKGKAAQEREGKRVMPLFEEKHQFFQPNDLQK